MTKYIKANHFFVDSFNFKTLTKRIKIKLQVKRAAVLSETDRNLQCEAKNKLKRMSFNCIFEMFEFCLTVIYYKTNLQRIKKK